MRADRDPPAQVAGVVHWGSQHDAWQATMLASPQDTHLRKEPLPVAVIIAVVEHRMGANGEPHDTLLEVESGPRRHVGSLRPHARDAQGRNWDVMASDAMKSTGPGGEAEFRRVLDALRDQFDMA